MSATAIDKMSLWERIRSRLLIFRARHLPHIVWQNDEVDVVVTFSEAPLREFEFDETPEGQQTAFERVFGAMNSGELPAIRKRLNAIGIYFDSSQGPEGFNWEWDFSLEGPIHVRFKRRARYPEHRT